MNQFLEDVIQGLSAPEKYLQSKYFYDATGDALFQQIMDCPEYYLTRCEYEIFSQQVNALAQCLLQSSKKFDIVELGAGDATKSIFLLKELLEQGIDFTYYPVDISSNVIALLQQKLPATLTNLHVHGLNGEYLPMLEKAKTLSENTKVVLFLGSNIGNVTSDQAVDFCKALRSHLLPHDLILIGFDLQKDPQTIVRAYSDEQGLTREFNLNLLRRINNELSGNFSVDDFSHFAMYDPGTGACKSYLISQQYQQVEVADHSFHFYKYEPVFMEVSQKYTLQQTDAMALQSGFRPLKHFFDSKAWFVDAIWQAV